MNKRSLVPDELVRSLSKEVREILNSFNYISKIHQNCGQLSDQQRILFYKVQNKQKAVLDILSRLEISLEAEDTKSGS